MHDHATATIAADLESINDVRDQASRRRQLTLRAVVLLALALALAAITDQLAVLPLLGVALLCAAIVIAHEVREIRRRRAVAGSLGRRWL